MFRDSLDWRFRSSFIYGPCPAAPVGIRIGGFQSRRHGGDFLLRLSEIDAGLESHVRFNPPCAAILQFVPARFNIFLHRRWNPKLHRPAHERPIKTLWHDTNNRVQRTAEPLRFSDDLRIALKAPFP